MKFYTKNDLSEVTYSDITLQKAVTHLLSVYGVQDTFEILNSDMKVIVDTEYYSNNITEDEIPGLFEDAMIMIVYRDMMLPQDGFYKMSVALRLGLEDF